jgi:hypothetical protein
MSFAILRHGKIKSTSRGAAISHNHRLGDVDQVNIDKDQKHLNRCFMGAGLAERIAGKLPAKVRKDAVVSVEVLLTSGPEFFDGIEKDRVKLSKNPAFLTWLAKSLDWAKKEFGSNLVDATLHMDESTPHLHLMAVPLTKDGRLCAKEVMGRTEMQRRQTSYGEAMKPLGLVRGEPATETKRRHIRLKEEAGSGGRASQLAAQLAKIKVDYERATRFATSQQKLNIENFHLINKLNDEIKKLKSREIDVRAPDSAQEALPEEWLGIPMASPMDARYGTPVAVFGRQVVLHMGRGKHVLHEVPEGQEAPRLQKTEQNKHGISR